ncbi:hypothetical protein MTO96_011794 [Rhipicephalus appendiculatus]
MVSAVSAQPRARMCARGPAGKAGLRGARRRDPAALCFPRGLGTPTSAPTSRWLPLVLSTAAVTSGRVAFDAPVNLSRHGLEALTSAARRSARSPDAAPERSAPGGRKIDPARRK